MAEETTDLKRTPLHDLHVSQGAKMVPFAGYEMPVSYPLGVLKEHLHTRAAAGLFDVSHMGQVILSGDDYATVAEGFEALVPVNAIGLEAGRQRYGLLTNNTGGIEDDLMFANKGDHMLVVINAACKAADIALLRAELEPRGRGARRREAPDLRGEHVRQDVAVVRVLPPRAVAALPVAAAVIDERALHLLQFPQPQRRPLGAGQRFTRTPTQLRALT